MRRCLNRVVLRYATAIGALRFAGEAPAGKKYDLFGYEVDTNTSPWIEKIKKVKYYDEAGELMVEMNVKNCPPDLPTYNATLQKIYECPSKRLQPIPNESKFCAMMDLIEEMKYRNKINPDKDSWTWVMKECVKSANFRMGYIVEKIMAKEVGGCPDDLVKGNAENHAKAAAEGREHPSVLSKQLGLFEVMEE